MQYENYERKVNKIADFMKLVFKHMTKIIITASVMLATTVALLATRGIIVSAESCPEGITYGEELSYSANAFISKVKYEYRRVGEDKWVTEAPKEPGTYNVRAVSKATFGYRYGDIETFVIYPKAVDVVLDSTSVVYGDLPTVTANMAYDDTIFCHSFIYNESRTSVKPNSAALVASDADGNDVSSRYVFNVVESTITTVPRPITVTAVDKEKVYDGTALSSEEYLLDGSIPLGDRLEVSFRGSITDAGSVENRISCRVFNAKGEDVSSFYRITGKSGRLTVTKREIILKTPSQEAVYDGSTLKREEYSVVEGTSLADGHKISITSWASIEDAGEKDNSFEFDIKDAKGASVTDNYSIKTDFGTLKINKRPITLSTGSGEFIYNGTANTVERFEVSGEYGLALGHVAGVGSWTMVTDVDSTDNVASGIYIIDSDGRTVTGNYEIEEKWGTVTVKKRPVTLTTEDLTHTYDGFEYYSYDVKGVDIASGDVIMVTEGVAYKNVGSYENSPKFYIESISRAKDVTDNYEITLDFGTVTVEKRRITITSESYEWVYEGVDLCNDAVVISGEGLAYGHYTVIDQRTTLKDVTDGVTNRLTVLINSEEGDVTANYDINYVYGTAKIVKRPITVYSGSISEMYDGGEHYHDTPDVMNMVHLHTFKVISSTRLINVGSTPNKISEYDILDEQGVSVKHNYSVDFVDGNIEVTKRPIAFTTADGTKIYDATPLTAPQWLTVDGFPELVEGHRIEAEAPTGSRTNYGSSPNTHTGKVYIYDAEGDVSYNYDIILFEGTLTVEKRPMTVVSGSISLVYDGKDHYSLSLTDDPSLGGMSICKGHYFDVTSYSIFNDVTDTSNVLSYRIYDQEGEDVYDNYDITDVYGSVVITERPITVCSYDITLVYDGKWHEDYRLYVDTGRGYDLCDGHEMSAIDWNYFKNVITDGENEVKAYILARVDEFTTRDVTHNYLISYDNGSVNISKRPIKITNASYNAVYDGYEHTNYEFRLDKSSGYYDLCDGQSFVYGEDYVVIKNVMDNVENAVSFFITDGAEDVTANYDTTATEFGRITVSKRPIKITNASYNAVYDGYEHTNYEFRLDKSSGYYDLCDGQSFVYGEDYVVIKNVMDNVENAVSFFITDGAEDVTANYDTTATEFGRITVRHYLLNAVTDSLVTVYNGFEQTHTVFIPENNDFYDILISRIDYVEPASRKNIGSVTNTFDILIYDDTGADATKNFIINFTSYGTITVTKRHISVESATETKPYDGVALTAPYFVEAEGSKNSFIHHHEYIADFNASIRIPGSIVNTYDIGSFRIMDGEENVTYNYEVDEYSFGTLTVVKRRVTLKSVDAEKVYDGRPLTAPYFVAGENSTHPLVDIHEYVATFSGTITVPGTAPNSFDSSTVRIYEDGVDVTEYYILEDLEVGTLRVTKRHISIESATDEKYYDGSPLTAPYFVAAGSSANPLLDYHDYVSNFSGSITNVGSAPNTYSPAAVRIFDGDVDVTKYYVIDEFLEGTLTVMETPDGDIPIGLPPMFDNEEMKKDVVYVINSSAGAPIYLKQKSYGSYTGKSWNAAEEYGVHLDGMSASYILPAILLYENIEELHSLTITPKKNTYVQPYYTIFDYAFPDGSDVKAVGDASAPYDLRYYAINTYGGHKAEGELDAYEQEYRRFVYSRYLDIDDETLEFMMGIIEAEGFDPADESIITDVAEYIQGAAEYDLNYNRALDECDNIAVAFLSNYKKGICQHYATAATLLYRTMGIPARYTVGYRAETVSGEDVEVTSADAHAWVEVYIDGHGWVYVEVTGGMAGGPVRPGPGGNGGGPGPSTPPKTTIEVMPEDIVKIYDGKPLYAENKIVETDAIRELLNIGFTYEVVVEGYQEGVGYSSSIITSFKIFNEHGEDVTENFEVILYDGLLEITYGIIEIYLYEKKYEYSGNGYYYDSDEYVVLSAPEGITLDVYSINLSLKDVGVINSRDINSKKSYFEYSVYLNGGTEDLASGYRVVVVDYATRGDYDVLTVFPRAITITTNSATRAYNSRPLTSNGFFISMGVLPEGYTVRLDVIGSITSVGKDDNTIDKESLCIFDGEGNVVTRNFDVTIVLGILEVV